MTNLSYIVAAYAISIGALGLYGVYLWSRLRHLEQDLTMLPASERVPYGRR
jgi:hypothetical protein